MPFAVQPRASLIVRESFSKEWYDPLISGICWVEELIETAGGQCIFSELRKHQSAKDRIVNPADVIAQNPEVIIGSWCGRAVKKSGFAKRDGWDRIGAIRNNHIYEVSQRISFNLARLR